MTCYKLDSKEVAKHRFASHKDYVQQANVIKDRDGNVLMREIKVVQSSLERRKRDGSDDLPAQIWKCLGEVAIKFLSQFYKVDEPYTEVMGKSSENQAEGRSG